MLEEYGGFELIAMVVGWIACIGFSGYLADLKGHNGMTWGCLAMVAGPLALLTTIGLPLRSVQNTEAGRTDDRDVRELVERLGRKAE